MKPYYQSKTLWLNGVTILVSVASFFGYVPNEALSQQVSTFLLVSSPLVNLILRLYTEQKLSFKK